MEAVIEIPGDIVCHSDKEKKDLLERFRTLGISPKVNALKIEIPDEIHILYPKYGKNRKKVEKNVHELIYNLQEIAGATVKYKQVNSSGSFKYVNNPHLR